MLYTYLGQKRAEVVHKPQGVACDDDARLRAIEGPSVELFQTRKSSREHALVSGAFAGVQDSGRVEALAESAFDHRHFGVLSRT